MARHPHVGHALTTETCQVCNQAKPARQTIPGSLIRNNLADFIQRKLPGWSGEAQVCFTCLNRLRAEYVSEQLAAETGALTSLEEDVVRSLRESELVADDLNRQYRQSLTVGDRIADKVAEFGGSWRFIILFGVFILVWVAVNSALLLFRPFDPYPFILLNLFLSMLAAIQAPNIMMSQNRQEDRDRLRAENDYKVNLKAELEIRSLGERLDQLIHHQWARLIEIQQIQVEMIEDLAARRGG
jgi:uncharacterized membrane protein